MEVSINDNVKIYNLSTGDSIPEWISSKRRRKLQKQHNDYRNTVRLIQDFEVPDVATSLAITRDGKNILATGTYKPVLKCYNVDDMTIKFEHGLDIHTLKVLPISDDYSKMVLLQDMRYLEVFSNGCRYFRFRVPRFNRDMTFSRECSDLFVVGDGPEVYRFNFEIGRFVTSLQSDASASNCCVVSDYHQLLLCGTVDGRIEAYDHRDHKKVGTLDCALSTLGYDIETELGTTAQITSITYKDALTFAAGTSTGHVLLYDLRSSNPILIKDHNMGLPILKVDFVRDQDIVLSMDSRMMKFWEEDSGKPLGAIESNDPLVDFVRYPDSGLLFFAAEAPQMQQYFVPMFGSAPKWCYHLDAIIEELDDVKAPDVYDDYKFVTKEMLHEIGLDHLIGTSLLRAHMHGYFIDVRLYNRAKTLTQPNAVKSLRRRKLRENMEKASTALPEPKQAVDKIKINKELAAQLKIEATQSNQKRGEKSAVASKILADDRFSSLFTDEEFTIDKDSEQFKKMAIATERRNASSRKKKDFDESEEEEDDGPKSGLFMEDEPMEDNMYSDIEEQNDEEESTSDEDSDSDEEDGEQVEHVESDDDDIGADATPAVLEVRKPKGFKFVAVENRRQLSTILASEKAMDEGVEETFGKRKKEMRKKVLNMDDTPFGTKSISFTVKSEKKAADEEKQRRHLEERRSAQRSAGSVLRTLKPLPRFIQGGSRLKKGRK